MGGYIDVIAAWLDGKPTSGLELFGLTMFWWGRMGKSMLFLAGLAIGLDLINPARLRARGQAAVDRSRKAMARSRLNRDRSRMIALQRAMQKDIYSLQPLWDGHITYVNLAINWPPAAVPRRLGLPLSDYRAFYRGVVGALPRQHMCRMPHAHVCWEQVAFVNHQVDELLFERLPDARDLLTSMPQGGREEGSHWRSLLMLFVWLQLAVVGMLVILVMRVAHSFVWATVAGVVGYIVIDVFASDRARLLIGAVTFRVGGVLQRAVGQVLQRARRLHFFRWIALGLFIFGSHFDLLAS